MTIPKAQCQRCGHTWILRTEHPKECPQCHSPYWNKPYKQITIPKFKILDPDDIPKTNRNKTPQLIPTEQLPEETEKNE